MPRGDGTGPMGYGPGTGWGWGYCPGYPAPGYAYPGFGLRGRRAARGRGWRFRAFAGWPGGPFPPAYCQQQVAPVEAELSALREEAKYLSDALENVRTRLTELEGEPKE